MKQAQDILNIRTHGQGFVNITGEIDRWVRKSHIQTGLLTVFIQHTSASLTIQENADPDVMDDLKDFLSRMVPEESRHYRHVLEGSDDMPAHIRSSLTDVSISIPVADGRMALGTWQGVYMCEHRAHGHSRRVALHLVGE